MGTRLGGTKRTDRKNMDDMNDIELLYAIYQAAQDLEEARLERNQCIREALQRGISPTRIAENAGISKTAVYRYKND